MEDIKKKDEAYMRRALMEAQAAFDEDEIPVGAVIVCKDRIISRAHNLTEMLTDVTAHAESKLYQNRKRKYPAVLLLLLLRSKSC